MRLIELGESVLSEGVVAVQNAGDYRNKDD